MLDLFYSHANLIEDLNSFTNLKSVIEEQNYDALFLELNEDDVNLKMQDLERIRDFAKTKSSNLRYILTNKNLRNTVVQNAFLKLLEEPSANVRIILCVSNISMLLPTIISRVNVVKIDSDSKNKDKTINSLDQVKNKLIQKKNFKMLEKLLLLEDERKRGLISEKQYTDFMEQV